MKRKTYTARCQRSGDWWAISVPELRGVHTQARRLEKAEAMARDAIALFLDVPSDAFDVRIEPVLPRDLQGKVGRARKARGACWGSPINGSPSCSRQLQGKASAPTGLAFAPLAPADPRAIAALDHAGTVWTTCILQYFMAVSGAERVASGRSRWGAPGTQRRSVDGDVELMRGLRLVETSARAGPSVGAGDVAGTTGFAFSTRATRR